MGEGAGQLICYTILKILLPLTLSEFGLLGVLTSKCTNLFYATHHLGIKFIFLFNNSIVLYFKVNCIVAVVTPGYLVQRVMAMVLEVVY